MLAYSCVQKVQQAFNKATTEHEKYKLSLAEDPEYLLNMPDVLQELEAQISQLERHR